MVSLCKWDGLGVRR